MEPSFPDPALSRQKCGLYLHIPFCETKCGYCDFFSVALKDRDTSPLIERLIRELDSRLADPHPAIHTIFCGGGTPTILPADRLNRLLQSITAAVSMSEVVEFTVEANPATLDDQKVALLVAAGVDRVSMGAQSFFPEELATLERLHSPDDIAPSVGVLRRHGITQINLDLMFGIPGQTQDTWSRSLDRAIKLEPDHIACYGLMYEPGTRLTAQRRRGEVHPCAESLEADLYLYAIDALAKAGYRQYEISNFARPGCECRHNLIYWRNLPYVGVGPSAVGCLQGRRYKNVADVSGYIRLMDERGHAEVESEMVSGQALMHEMILMQLRLVAGLSISDFHRRTGLDPLTLFDAALDHLVNLDLVHVSDTHIALTSAGRLVADSVMVELAAALNPDDSVEIDRATSERRLPVTGKVVR